MKNIKIKLLMFIAISFFMVTGISAEEYKCTYKANFEDEGEITRTITINTTDQSLDLGYSDSNRYIIDVLKEKNKIEEIVSKLNGNCPKYINMCLINVAPLGGRGDNYYTFLFNNSLDYNNRETFTVKISEIMTVVAILDSCEIATIVEGDDTTGSVKDNLFSCEKYDTLYKELLNYHKINNLDEYNKTKDKLREYCKSISKYQDYSNVCLTSCLKLNKELGELEENKPELTCGLSERVILWVANIVRWVKYIVPVMVIILSILDFIKITGTDKEDEIKKSQGKFVRRLISAALIFIIPFIIEFILIQMGFNVNGCGIIDL